MIPSGRAFALLGCASLLFVFSFVSPALGVIGLGLDALIVVLTLWDGHRAGRVPLDVTRSCPPVVHQGQRFEVEVSVANPGSRPLSVQVRERLDEVLLEVPVTLDLSLPPRSRVRRAYAVLPRRRGRVTLAPAAVRVLGPSRLCWSERKAAPQQEVKVYPAVRFEGEAGLALQRALERRPGSYPLRARGISREMYALRAYRAGDDLSEVHWKATARLRRPIVRETTWEQHQHIVVLLDCGRPMASLDGVHTKLDHALAAIVALLRVAVAQRDEVTLVLFSKEVRVIVQVDRRTRSFAQVFERVYREQADLEEPDYAAVAAWCARRVPRRSLALLCTSVVDLVAAERLGDALRGLAHRHLPLLVNLADPALEAHATSIPEDVLGAFAKTSALTVLEANRALEAGLRGRGVEVLSVPADRLAMGVVQRYLDLKALRRL